MASKTVSGWIHYALAEHGRVSKQDMAGASRRIGMQVRTSDDFVLGTITTVWQGADATDRAPHEDTLGVTGWRPEQGVAGQLYIPSHAIARVADQVVILTVEEAQVTARGWRHRPQWLPQDEPREAVTGTKA